MKALRVLLTGLSVLLPAAAAAQDFPTKPIRLIVPFPPGGPNDIIARLVGQRMSEITKQPVVIDNRGGQAGVLGTDAIAKSTPMAIRSESSARARWSSTRPWKRCPTTSQRISRRSRW